MYYKEIDAFAADWDNETAATARTLEALTDESLAVRVTPEHRALGDLAWHLVLTMHEMLSRTGLQFEAPHEHAPVPATAAAIAEAYRSASRNMLEAVRGQWTDAELAETSDMYGEEWPNGVTLGVLVAHEIHHRGQMTVLMRQAGLRVPDIYGPTREQWFEMGMTPPPV